MSYRILIHRHVQRQIDALPSNVRQRIRRLINELPANPRPSGASHLRGYPHIWRYRLERWRLVWRIYDEELLVMDECLHASKT